MDIITSISQELSDIFFIGQFIGWIHELVQNYGLTVILFTLFLKLITLPLDYWSRLKMKKTSAAQKELKPFIEQIDKRYPDDPQKANLEKQALYKKHGISLTGGCLPLIVTMVIFIFMFRGLSTYSAYSSNMLYNKLAESYNSAYNGVYSYEQRVLDKEEIDKITLEISDLEAELIGMTDESLIAEKTAELDSKKELKTQLLTARSEKEAQANEVATRATADTFDAEREGFLWVMNIYRPDSSANVFATYSEAVSSASTGQGIDKNQITKEQYDLIYNAVMQSQAGKGYTDNHWNGLFILPILSMGLSVLSSIVSQKSNKVSGAPVDLQVERSNKMTMFMMPLLYALFVFQYTAAVAVYMVSSSLFSILSGLIINPITDKKAEAAIRAQFDSNKPGYMRK